MIATIVLGVMLALSAPPTENWQDFRGAQGDGISLAKDLPLTWSETQNVKWKTALPGIAWSTPVVWGKQVWMTDATLDGKQMFAVCLDRDTGKILLNRKVFDNADPEPLGTDVNSYGSPSPVIEAGRVYLNFGSYGTACLDTKTFKTLWERRDLPCRHLRGPGSSPFLYGNLLILTMDGADYQYLVALDKRTGQNVWKEDRSTQWTDLDPSGKVIADGDLRKAYTTPLLTQWQGNPLLISIGAMSAFAYDPRTGKEIWKARFNGFSNASRPLVGFGMTYLSTGYNRADLLAVKLGGSGDITNTHIAWRYTRNVPQKPSALLVGDTLFMVSDSGVATCLDAKTGTEIWKERIGGSYSASPIYADGRIYCFSEDGKSVVLSPGRKYQVLAENQLAAGFMASPAVAGKALFLRTKTHVYRIEN